jgi:hypothetical protein
MTRTSLIHRFGLACLLPSALFAANKPDRVVEAVLAQEAREPVVRRADVLAGSLADSERARWAAGLVQTAEGWQPFDSTVLQAAAGDAVREYQARRGTEPLTAEQHLELANWCREQKLVDQERAHLWAVLTTHPQQQALWQRLGYRHVDGEWLTQAEQQQMEQRRRQQERNVRVWLPKAQALARRLANPSETVQGAARSELLEIDDLAALPGLERSLCTNSGEHGLAFVEWARRHPHTETTLALARQGVISPFPAVRTLAIDVLSQRRLDHFAPALLSTLATPAETQVYADASARQSGQIVYVYQFRRELWDTIQQGTYAVRLGRPRSTRLILLSWDPFAFNSTTMVQLNGAIDARQENDFARSANQQTETLNQSKATADAQQAQWNQRVSDVLSGATGAVPQTTPQQWWTWWASLTSTIVPSSSDKQVLEVSETVVVEPFIQLSAEEFRTSDRRSCLPAGTLIRTDAGLRPIDALRIGDRVLAKDIDTGELAYRPVLRTTVRTPQPLVRLHSAGETIAATRGHYFWVSGRGWRMAREIQPGDRLHGVLGTVTVTDVSSAEPAAVYNLVVDRANTYFVGAEQILSHDVTPPAPTDIVVPGLPVAGR